MRVTDRELRRVYRVYNRRYFRGKLPKNFPVRFAAARHFSHRGIYGHLVYPIDVRKQLRPQSGAIFVREGLREFPAVVAMTLLHEMVHLKLAGRRCQDHGRLFTREMKRLAARGAFSAWW